jgi:hypothetical protein
MAEIGPSTSGDNRQEPRRDERLLIAVACLGAIGLLGLAIGLWLRFGEGVYVARVVSMLQSCF